MLSENQREIIKNKVNAETDIPFLKESTEDKIIDQVLETINPYLEPSFRALCPRPYVDCLKIALAEGESSETKRDAISNILEPILSKPLGQAMAGKIDVSLVPEYMEEKILAVVCKKIVDEMIEWTVGEIDERFDASLQKSREATGQ